MDGWKKYVGKRVFLRTKYNRVYSGNVIEIDDSDKQVVFLTIIDIKGMNVTFAVSEIIEIKEEQNEGSN
jgi:small nuclear ribonucleoprotein (snRNP)-like protein